ncbi:MAG: heparinase II/III family protein [Alphaproteobacteria bacterium]|jgi:uncharacterized heparinase superfamily protein|nr:heparinase II/III family protein [Alphaproteobacteria bacterium]
MTIKSFSKNASRMVRDTWRRSVLYRFTLMGGPTPKHLTVMPTDPWPGDIYAGRLLLDGKFMLSNQVISMTDLWIPKDAEPAALADLHRFTWLRDLRALGDNSARRLARQLITNWIDRNQDWQGYPWQVGITGHRIANWIAMYDFFCSSADESFRSLFFREVARQARHLSYSWADAQTSLERLYALKGMIYAAITFPGESHRLATLLPSLEIEIGAQILADGGHESRCPQTHLMVLRDLIDIRAMLRLIHYEIPPFLQTSINQMAPIVRLFRHGDGGLATFGQTSCVPSPVIDMVLSLADVRGRPPERAVNLGFERCVNKSSLILLNVGAKINGVQPTVADEGTGSLNFEWSIGRDRFVLQGDLVLQTPEGKVIPIPEQVDSTSIKLHRASHKGHTLVDASFACPEGSTFSHRRQLYLDGNHPNLRGEDTIQAPLDAVYGIRFILDKDIEASLASGGKGVMILIPARAKSARNQEGQQWRLLVSGVEEILCETYDSNQAILLLGCVKDNQPISVRWAFCQD